jgi:hypothetical protein
MAEPATLDEWKAFLTAHATPIDDPELYKRRSWRFRLKAKTALTIRTAGRHAVIPRTCRGTVIDTSEEGISVSVNVALAEETSVHISLQADQETIELEGQVSYCRRTGLASYRTGLSLQFDDE